MPGTDAEIDGDFAGLLDVLGRRWTPRLIWELRDGSLHFTELRRRAGGLSQSVLVTRLGELTVAGLVDDVEGSYGLTPGGDAVAGRLRELAHRTPDEPAEPVVADPPVHEPVVDESPVVESPAAQPPPARPSPGARPRPRPRPHR